MPTRRPRTRKPLSECLAEVDTPRGRARARRIIRAHPNPDALTAPLTPAERRRVRCLWESIPKDGQALAELPFLLLERKEFDRFLADLRPPGLQRALLAEAERGLNDVDAAKTMGIDEFRAELDRRLTALDQGEVVDPPMVRRELQARSRNVKKLQAKMPPASRTRSEAKARVEILKIEREDAIRFAQALTAPPQPNAGLRRLLRSRPVWERMRKAEVLTLSERDAKRVAELLRHPPAPNARLRKAAAALDAIAASRAEAARHPRVTMQPIEPNIAAVRREPAERLSSPGRSWAAESTGTLAIPPEQRLARRGRHRVPTHPGVVLEREFLAPQKRTQAALAAQAGLPLRQVRALIQGKQRITPAIARGLAQALGTTPTFWLNLQMRHDQARVVS
jgi:antitoxin HigA-1